MDPGLLLSKFKGALLGTAVGDALGASFEGGGVLGEALESLYPKVIERRRTLVYTDDTHMMIGVAESLIEKKGFDPEHMAWTFIRNWEEEPFRGYGPGPPRIFRMIKNGEPWDKAARKLYGGGSFGNGAAMRIAPIGVFFHDRPEELKEAALRSSDITHAHPLGREGGLLQAGAVALATKLKPEEKLDPEEFLLSLSGLIEEEVLKAKLIKIGELLGRGERNPERVARELGNGVEAQNSVPSAIFSFLSHPHSFREAVLFAISLGGDTDTIGAMTGAISGAFLGSEAIPEEWKRRLENRSYIEELGRKLWEIKTKSPRPEG